MCVRYHQLRTQAAPAPERRPRRYPGPGRADRHRRPADAEVTAAAAAAVADALAEMEHQILGKILQVVSGPGGAASFLRRHLLGKPLAGPSLPLDVGQTDDIPLHLRRLVALRDQTCQFAGGCDQPASGCEPHHVTHRADGGHTSLTNLKDYCWWHHHVVLHELGWTLTVHPDGTSQVTEPRRQDHPQPQPATPPRVTIPALGRTPLPRRSRGAVASVPCRRRPGPRIVVARASTARMCSWVSHSEIVITLPVSALVSG